MFDWWESPFFGQDNATAGRNILMIGLPGMVILGVICLVKTHNPLHAVVAMPLVMAVSFVFAYLVFFVIYLAIALVGLKAIFSSLYSGRYKCGGCGCRLSGNEGTCPGCGARLA